MDNNIPSFGTNGGTGPIEHHNIFDMFQGFLGQFWGGHGDMMGALQDGDSPMSKIMTLFGNKGQ